MAETSTGIPDRPGDLTALGLEQRRPLILPADEEITEETEPQETEPEKPAKAAAEKVVEEPQEQEEEKEEEDQESLLEKYAKLSQPPEASPEETKTARELELERRLARQEAQLEELLRQRNQEIAAKAEQAGKEEGDELDLTSEVVLKYLAETEDPIERERLRMRLLQDQLKTITSKQYGSVQSTLEQTQQEVQKEAASREFQAQVQNTLDQVAQAGDIERQLVEQWNATPKEQRKNTLLGQRLARNPMIAFNPESLSYLVRGMARDIESSMKSGTVRQPTSETTGASSRAAHKSQNLTKKPSEVMSEEDKFIQHLKGLGSLGEDLAWMKK